MKKLRLPPLLLSASAAFLLVLTGPTLHAAEGEDPVLGIIRDIKCVQCKPGLITLTVYDAVERRTFDIDMRTEDYNRISRSLRGVPVRQRDNSCFYWRERLPAAPRDSAAGPAAGESLARARPALTAQTPQAAQADGAAQTAQANGAAAPDSGEAMRGGGEAEPKPAFRESRCHPFTFTDGKLAPVRAEALP